MSKNTRSRKPYSSTRLTLCQRLRRSWTRWRAERLKKKQEREQKRYRLMQVQMDYQLLELKRLEETLYLTLEQLREMEESADYRLKDQLPEEENREYLENLLGLTPPH